MKNFLYIVFLLVSIAAGAQVKVAQLQTASSRFRQTRTSPMLQAPEVRTGSFSYTAPNKIQWKYDGLENVKLPDQMLSLIRQAVSGDMKSVNTVFTTTWQGHDLTMVPKQKQLQNFFKSIQIQFTTEGVAHRVILKEPSGSATNIEFINLKYTKKG